MLNTRLLLTVQYCPRELAGILFQALNLVKLHMVDKVHLADVKCEEKVDNYFNYLKDPSLFQFGCVVTLNMGFMGLVQYKLSSDTAAFNPTTWTVACFIHAAKYGTKLLRQ